MGEMVENIQKMGDGMQVHPLFRTDEKKLEYKDLMMNTFTQTTRGASALEQPRVQ